MTDDVAYRLKLQNEAHSAFKVIRILYAEALECMRINSKDVFSTPKSALINAEKRSGYSYPVSRTILVALVMIAVAYVANFPKFSQLNVMEVAATSIATGIIILLFLHTISLFIAFLMKIFVGGELKLHFYRSLYAIYILPISVAVISVAIYLGIFIVSVTN